MAQTQSSVNEISERFISQHAALDPVTATFLGIPGHDDKLADYSPDGYAARAELARNSLAAIGAAEPANGDEELAKAVFTERISVERDLYDAGLTVGDLNVIASPVQGIRQVFDLMPTGTAEQWANIGGRLAAVPACLAGLRASYQHAAAGPHPPALRQVRKVAEQCETWSGRGGDESFFDQLVKPASQVDGVTDALTRYLTDGAQAAASAYAELADYLRTELVGRATPADACGADVYRLQSRSFLGADIDPIEAYEWGWAEFSRIESEMLELADRIKPGAGLAAAAEALDADPRYQVVGQRAFEEWMQRLSDQALADTRNVHFDIPDPVMTLMCKIAPPGGGVGAYYTAPSDDFSRPGHMWWSVLADKEVFTTWREVSIVYHEGVPGHHLQAASAIYVADRLNSFQRLMAWSSGHGEGWALYAERLMRELGYFDDDGNLFGMLDSQLFRAARVVVDIGMHLQLPIPAGTGFHPGERWTPELGLEFMLNRTVAEPSHIHDEIDRYLGWPGQAPSYKLGERLWLEAREDVRRRAGGAFDLKAFHTAALRMGSMGLDTLREQLAKL